MAPVRYNGIGRLDNFEDHKTSLLKLFFFNNSFTIISISSNSKYIHLKLYIYIQTNISHRKVLKLETCLIWKPFITK